MDKILKSNCSNVPISSMLYILSNWLQFQKSHGCSNLSMNSGLTIVKATKQYFPVEMFIMQYLVVLRLFLWMKSFNWQIVRALLLSVLFSICCTRLVVTSDSVDEILIGWLCESVLIFNLWIFGFSKWKLLSSTYLWYSILFCTIFRWMKS